MAATVIPGRFHTAVPGRPEVIDGRYYIARRAQRVVVLDQPRVGFRTPFEAEAWLVGRLCGEWERAPEFITVEAGQIDDGLVRR